MQLGKRSVGVSALLYTFRRCWCYAPTTNPGLINAGKNTCIGQPQTCAGFAKPVSKNHFFCAFQNVASLLKVVGGDTAHSTPPGLVSPPTRDILKSIHYFRFYIFTWNFFKFVVNIKIIILWIVGK